MTISSRKSTWRSAILVILIAIGSFLLFRQILPERLFSEIDVTDEKHRAVDEWMQSVLENKERADSLADTEPLDASTSQDGAYIDSIKASDTSSIVEKMIEVPIDQIGEGVFLDLFYSRLFSLEKNPEKEKVRVAYFGDSMVDGDLIVQDIRRLFQEKYGGRGVGFVPITSESARSRASIVHNYSDNWQVRSFMRKQDKDYPLGITGSAFYASDTLNPTFVHYRAGVNRGNSLLTYPTLYYGQSLNDSARVETIIKNDTLVYPLNPDHLLNTLLLKKGIISEMKLQFIHADSIPIYGVNFDIPIGVQVDNFSNRGNSGLPITQLNVNLMRAFQKDFHYDLIVLHFGTNVLSSEMRDYAWYKVGMKRVVTYLRRVFPEASILVISIADKSSKYGTEMRTDSAVGPLLSIQQAFAEETKVGFVNLYKLMGGEGSMIKWVEEEPELANKDYTHFNARGARKIADMIYNCIDDGYTKYKEVLKMLEVDKQQDGDSIK